MSSRPRSRARSSACGEVATREPAVNRRQKADREQPDEKFKEVMALRVQRRKFAVSNSKLPRDGEHVDEGCACGLGLSVDLGQYLEGLARDGEDADDLPRLQAPVGSGQNRRFRAASAAGRPVRRRRGAELRRCPAARHRRSEGSPTPGRVSTSDGRRSLRQIHPSSSESAIESKRPETRRS